MNFDNLVMGLKNGDFDIVSACMSADDKRRESIDFTDIVYNTDTVLVTKKEVADNYQKPEDLAGHKIAAQTGSKPYERAVPVRRNGEHGRPCKGTRSDSGGSERQDRGCRDG